MRDTGLTATDLAVTVRCADDYWRTSARTRSEQQSSLSRRFGAHAGDTGGGRFRLLVRDRVTGLMVSDGLRYQNRGLAERQARLVAKTGIGVEVRESESAPADVALALHARAYLSGCLRTMRKTALVYLPEPEQKYLTAERAERTSARAARTEVPQVFAGEGYQKRAETGVGGWLDANPCLCPLEGLRGRPRTTRYLTLIEAHLRAVAERRQGCRCPVTPASPTTTARARSGCTGVSSKGRPCGWTGALVDGRCEHHPISQAAA